MTITLRALNDDDLNDIFRWESDPAAARMASFTLEGNRELTYWVDPSRWGRGIASGAVRLLILDEPRRPLYARAAEHNLGSRRVLERNGFVEIGEETAWADGVGKEVVEHIYRHD